MSVCADLPPDTDVGLEADLAGDLRVSLLYTGGKRGACNARNLGLERAESKYVCFLDDDDWFVPGRFEEQLEIVANRESEVIAAGRARYWSAGGTFKVVPRTTYVTGAVGDYLFRSRRLAADRNLIPTPTWLLSTDLARQIRWTDGLARHQDWDFLLRATNLHGVRIVQTASVVAEVSTESPQSITSAAGGNSSFEWAQQMQPMLSPEAFADFVFGQSVRHALQSRNLRLAYSYARQAMRVSRPSVQAVILGLSGVIPRGPLMHIVHAMTRAESAPIGAGQA